MDKRFNPWIVWLKLQRVAKQFAPSEASSGSRVFIGLYAAQALLDKQQIKVLFASLLAQKSFGNKRAWVIITLHQLA